MEPLRIGTCSWRYPSWARLVYRDGKGSGAEMLAEYATRYDTVEIDRWFWSLGRTGAPRMPDPRDVAAYRDAVPAGFTFAVKAPNSVTLTHHYRKAKTAPLVANPHFLSAGAFAASLDALAPLGDTLGPILFQFEYLNRQKMPSEVAFQERFAAFAKRLPQGHTYALEVRNPRYLHEGLFAFLRELEVLPVLISGYWMPPLAGLLADHRDTLARFPAVVVRLMGEDRAAIEQQTGETWNRIVAPHDAELDAVAAEVTRLRAAGVRPFVYVNNHYEGSAPLTIERLRERLGIASPPRADAA